jgi:hypothetical protein
MGAAAMSPEMIEFTIVIVGALLILGVVIEVAKMALRLIEDRREQARQEHRIQRWLREEVNKKDSNNC